MSNPTVYGYASDHNIFYADTPSTDHLIYLSTAPAYNRIQTLSQYKSFADRTRGCESHSLTGDVHFISTVGSSPDFLHIAVNSPTIADGGGALSTPGTTTDYDLDTRDAVTPDIGADENGTHICIAPISAPATAIQSTSALTHWTGQSGGNLILEYGPHNFTPGTGAAAGVTGTVVPITAGTTSQLISGLTVFTTYNYYVRQRCGGTAYTPNSQVQVFTTDTTPLCTHAPLPYTEGFEGIAGTGFLPDCMTTSPPISWGVAQTIVRPQPYLSAALTAHGGIKYAAVSDGVSSPGRGYFITPSFHLTAGTTYRASVWYQTDTNHTADISISYNSSSTDTSLRHVIARVQHIVSSGYALLTDTFVVNATGDYNVFFSAQNSHGYIAMDDLYVGENVPMSPVWPGDADNNRVVDNTDLLPLGLAYAHSGPNRTIQSIVWQGDPALDWGSNQPSGVNEKYADCNGDGTVNAADTLAINQNFSLTHPKTDGSNEPWRSQAAVLSIQYNQDTLRAGDTAIISFSVNDSVGGAIDLYGLAFSFHYDPAVYDSNTVSYGYTNSWLASSNNSISLRKLSRASGILKTGVTGIDHTDRNGSGLIGYFKAVVDTAHISHGQNSYTNALYITDVTAVVNNGQLIQVNAGSASSTIDLHHNQTPSAIHLVVYEQYLNIFPSPAQHRLNLIASDEIMDIRLSAITGQDIIHKKCSMSQTSLDIDDLASGPYILYVSTDKQNYVRKILIQH